MAITLAQAQAQLDAWLAASLAVATSQSYRIGTRTLTRADAGEIRRNIAHWERKVAALESGRRGVLITRVVPRDDV